MNTSSQITPSDSKCKTRTAHSSLRLRREIAKLREQLANLAALVDQKLGHGNDLRVGTDGTRPTARLDRAAPGRSDGGKRVPRKSCVGLRYFGSLRFFLPVPKASAPSGITASAPRAAIVAISLLVSYPLSANTASG